MSIDKKAFGISDSLINAVKEALKGGQVKLDKNKNGKIDGQDFKMLRKEETVDEKAVSKAQQKAAGAALATQRGEYDGGKKGGAINRMALMKASELRKIAGTKTKNLPMRKEEIEQVDELSKKTMGSYVKKASHDVATKSAATGRYADRANAIKDQMKKGDYSNYQQGKKDDATADKMFNKSWKRRAGIAKATDKLTKEEIEQVDELSKKTMGSYVKKALDTGSEKSVSNLASRGGYEMGSSASDNVDAGQKHDRKAVVRSKGIQRAVNKLTKEEVNSGFAEATENPITKQLAAKRTEIQKTIAQKRMQIMQQKAQKTIAAMKESKCSCMEGKKSMTCETHGDKAMGMKRGKEQIQINPPLRD